MIRGAFVLATGFTLGYIAGVNSAIAPAISECLIDLKDAFIEAVDEADAKAAKPANTDNIETIEDVEGEVVA